MGTSWHVQLAPSLPTEAERLRDLVSVRLAELVAQMSHWEPSSLLCRFNHLPDDGWLSLPPDFATVISAALTVARRSHGAFDPTIGALVDLWGFGPPGAQSEPDLQAIAQIKALTGWERLEFDPAARRLRQPGGTQLDLSGIAKGYAVDALARMIEAMGHHNFMVEIGGELAGRGMRPDGDPWWVELETPAGGLQRLRIALHELAVATSGDYVRGAHTIDPRTGRPCPPALMVASVVHQSAMLADAWASALIVLGPSEGKELAAREGIAARLIARSPSGGCEEILTPALAAML
jgi:FAD:protein FMN transferase